MVKAHTPQITGEAINTGLSVFVTRMLSTLIVDLRDFNLAHLTDRFASHQQAFLNDARLQSGGTFLAASTATAFLE
jgi:hypothetical protein